MNQARGEGSALSHDADLLATQEELDRRFCEAVSQRDIDQFMNCFWNSPDLIFVGFDGTVLRGADNVRQAMEGSFAQSESLGMVIDEVSHIPQGESVFAVGTATFEMRAKDGTSQQVRERWTDLRRKVGGRWVYVLVHAHAIDA